MGTVCVLILGSFFVPPGLNWAWLVVAPAGTSSATFMAPRLQISPLAPPLFGPLLRFILQHPAPLPALSAPKR